MNVYGPVSCIIERLCKWAHILQYAHARTRRTVRHTYTHTPSSARASVFFYTVAHGVILTYCDLGACRFCGVDGAQKEPHKEHCPHCSKAYKHQMQVMIITYFLPAVDLSSNCGHE